MLFAINVIAIDVGMRVNDFSSVLLTAHLSTILVIKRPYRTKSCFIILLYASTCFEHYVHIIRRSKLYYTASGVITPVGGRPVHQYSLNQCTGRRPKGVMIPEAV